MRKRVKRETISLNVTLPKAREFPQFLSKKDRPRRTGAVVTYQGKRYVLERRAAGDSWLAVEFPDRNHIREIPDSKLKGSVEYYR